MGEYHNYICDTRLVLRPRHVLFPVYLCCNIKSKLKWKTLFVSFKTYNFDVHNAPKNPMYVGVVLENFFRERVKNWGIFRRGQRTPKKLFDYLFFHTLSPVGVPSEGQMLSLLSAL